MKVDRKTFADAVAQAMVAVPKRPTQPIMAGVKLEAYDGMLTVSGSDYDTQAMATVPCDGELPTTLVDGTLLKQITSQSKGKALQAEIVGNLLQVKAGRANAVLPTMPVEDYPAPLLAPDDGFTIDGTAWDVLARSVGHAASKDLSLIVLSGINFEVANGELTVTATDRYRMAENTVSVTGDFEGSFLVSASTVLDVQRHLSTAATWQVNVSDSLVAVTDDSSQIIRTLIDGSYPKIKTMFPESSENNVTVNRQELIDAIARASALLGRNEPIRLSFIDDTITIEAGTSEHGAMTEQLDCANFAGSGESLKFNPLYLAETLKALVTDDVVLGWTLAHRPVTITAITDEGPDLLHRQMLMPIRF